MDSKHKRLMNLSENQLIATLTKRKKHKVYENKLREEVLALKEARRRQRIKLKEHKRLWRQLLAPLNYEMRNVGVLIRYQQAKPSPDHAYLEVLEAYNHLMDKLKTYLEREARTEDATPAHLAKQRTKRYPHGVPNNGIHWTDWVPPHIKAAMLTAWGDMPFVRGIKRKALFTRVLSGARDAEGLTAHDKAKAVLRMRTEKELEGVMRLTQVEPDPEKLDRLEYDIERMRLALDYIETMKQNEVVPHTWHGLPLNGGE
jgi:hypothetical protein